MIDIDDAIAAGSRRFSTGHRRGRPLVFSLTETIVLVLVAAALIATAAVPALVRHPHYAQAKTVPAAARSGR